MPRGIKGSGPKGRKRLAKAASSVPRKVARTGTTIEALSKRAQALQVAQMALASDLFEFLLNGGQ